MVPKKFMALFLLHRSAPGENGAMTRVNRSAEYLSLKAYDFKKLDMIGVLSAFSPVRVIIRARRDGCISARDNRKDMLEHSYKKSAYLPFLMAAFIFFSSLPGCTVQHTIKDRYDSIRHNLQGNYYLDNKKYDQGLAVFQKELEAKPKSPESHYYLGRFHLALEHPKRALTYLEQATILSPRKADYHFWHGVAAAAGKKHDIERKSYEQALKLDPDHVQALIYLGHNHLEKGKYRKALKNYSRAIELQPENPQALFNRGLILMHLKRTPEEKLAWKQYLYYYPSGPMAQRATANLNALGDFAYRNHMIGKRTVTLERVQFEPFSKKIWSGSTPSLDLLGEIMKNNHRVRIHIVTYQKSNRALAEARAKSIKKYVLGKFPEIGPSRLKVSWFDVPERIKVGGKTFTEDESVHFITAVPDKKTAGSRSKGKGKR